MIKHEWENIGCYAYPNAYIYADRTKIEDGSYQEVARVLKCPAEIQYRKGHKIPTELKRDAEECLQNIFDEQDKIIGYNGVEVWLYRDSKDKWSVVVSNDMRGSRIILSSLSDKNADRIKAECAKRGCKCTTRIIL